MACQAIGKDLGTELLDDEVQAIILERLGDAAHHRHGDRGQQEVHHAELQVVLPLAGDVLKTPEELVPIKLRPGGLVVAGERHHFAQQDGVHQRKTRVDGSEDDGQNHEPFEWLEVL